MTNFTPQMNLALTLAALNTLLTKRIDSPLSYHGISFTEFMVMHHLNNAANQCMRRIDLAEKIGLTASGVTRLLLPMEKIGLIQKEKNPRDARVSLVKLCDAGNVILADASNTFEQSTQKLFESLEPSEIDELSRISNKLL